MSSRQFSGMQRYYTTLEDHPCTKADLNDTSVISDGVSHETKDNCYELKLLQDDTESNSDDEEPMISASSKDNFTPTGYSLSYSG